MKTWIVVKCVVFYAFAALDLSISLAAVLGSDAYSKGTYYLLLGGVCLAAAEINRHKIKDLP